MNEIVKADAFENFDTELFNHPQFGELTVITLNNGELWFIADEVCKKLKIKNTPQALSRLDDDEKNTICSTYSINIKQSAGNPNRAIINESGLYSLTLSSRKKEAKAFKRWLTHGVVPSIRKHGYYIAESQLDGYVTIDELAKLYSGDRGRALGRNRAFEILRMTKHLMSNGMHKNVPYQEHIDNGHMVYKTVVKSTTFGAQTHNVVLIPARAIDYFFTVFDRYYTIQIALPTVKQIKLF